MCAVFGDRIRCGPCGCAPFCCSAGMCSLWVLVSTVAEEREFHRDWMCVWKCYGNKLGLPGLLVTSMLIVASV